MGEEKNQLIKSQISNEISHLQEAEAKTNKLKYNLVLVSFIIAFIFIVTGAIMSYQNYQKTISSNENKSVIINKVEVKEN